MNKRLRLRLRKQVPGFAEKVAPLYDSLAWTWGNHGSEHIPTVRDIKEELRRLIDELVLVDGSGEISSGGLCVWIDGVEAGLRFIIEPEC